MNLESIAAELYAGPLSEFVAARTAAVASAKSSGEKDLAHRVGKLPKPSVAAWLSNLLVASRSEDIRAIIDVGADIRSAEGDRNTDELRRLGRKRQQLISSVSQAGAQLGAAAGTKASAGAVRELEQTLQAALADPAAADAMLTGTLLRSLSSNGVEPVDLSGASALDVSAVGAEKTTSRLHAVDTTETERDSREAHRKLADAEHRADEAASALAAVEKRLAAIGPEMDDLTAERKRLRARLATVEDELRARSAENDTLRAGLASARHEAAVAGRAVARARERAARLDRGSARG